MPNNNRGRGRSRRGRQNYRRRQPIIPRPWRSPDPPPFNPVPWMYLTIEFQYLTLMHDIPGVLTVQDITTAITDRLGITINDGNWTVIQLHGIGVWETTGAGITLTVSDLDHPTVGTTNDQAAISTLYDRAGRNKWAHVVYVWPRDMRNNTFNTSQDDFAVAYITVAPENATDSTKVHVYLRLRWRTSKASSTPAHVYHHPSNAVDPVPQERSPCKVPQVENLARYGSTERQSGDDNKSWEVLMEEEEMIQEQLEKYAERLSNVKIKENHY